MRKLILFVTILLVSTSVSNAFANGATDIPMEIVKEGGMGNPLPKSPQNSIIISQDDYELTIPQLGENFTLQLRNDSGAICYSVSVPIGTTSVMLPTTLFGNYEIRLVASTYYYYGYIEL